MKWQYQVWLTSIEGEVEADTDDDAMTAAMQDALERADERISNGTWTLRQIEDGRGDS